MWKQSFFSKIEKAFFDYISRNSAFIQNTRRSLSPLDKQFVKAEEAFEKLSKDIKHATPDPNCFESKVTFIKEP
jgi:transcription-repair coupling factor (superfamily II helicase)